MKKIWIDYLFKDMVLALQLKSKYTYILYFSFITSILTLNVSNLELKKLIFNSILLKILIYILVTFFSFNINLIGISVYILLVYTFFNSKRKTIFLFKILILIQFWIIFSIILESSLFSFIFSILGLDFLNFYEEEQLFSINTSFSNMDNSNSKHIFDALHGMLKSLNFHNIFPKNNKSPFPENSFRDIFLDTGLEVKCPFSDLYFSFAGKELVEEVLKKSMGTKVTDLTSEEIDKWEQIIIQHNKDVLPRIDICLPYLNKILGNNSWNLTFKNEFYSPNTKSFIEKFGCNRYFEGLIELAAKDYNFYQACKIYYESENKNLVPLEFKEFWFKWKLTQIHFFSVFYDIKDFYMPNFVDPLTCYYELNDTIFITGVKILFFVKFYEYILQNSESKNDYDNIIKHFDLFNKDFYNKFYPFFHHFSWNAKLFHLNLWMAGEDNRYYSYSTFRESNSEHINYHKSKIIDNTLSKFNAKKFFQKELLTRPN